MKTINRLIVLLVLCFVIKAASGHSHQEAVNSISQAIDNWQTSDFIAEISHPDFMEFKGVDKVVFYQRHTPQGDSLLRADMYKGGKPTLSFIKNDTGQYVIDRETSYVARGGHFQRLFFLQSNNYPIYHFEMEHCNYTISSTHYAGRPCTKIIMRIPSKTGENGIPELYNLVGYLPADDEKIKKTHPCVREFIIDTHEKIILRLRKYNFYGKEISDIKIDKIQFDINWNEYTDIFETPGRIDFSVGNYGQFKQCISFIRGKQGNAQSGEKFTTCFWRVCKSPITVYACIGIAFISLVCLRIARKKQY